MTERKPPGISFTSWIDQQINEATERGAFDNLPGAGKPIPNRGDDDDGQAWLRDYLRREGVSTEELLPTPLKLRKEISRLPETVQNLRSEQEVRDVVADLNHRIMEWRRIPLGPPIFVPLVAEETVLDSWRDGRKVTPPISPPAEVSTRATEPERPRWRRLRRRAQR
jgi:Domain of unknown function (DUF1992)